MSWTNNFVEGNQKRKNHNRLTSYKQSPEGSGVTMRNILDAFFRLSANACVCGRERESDEKLNSYHARRCACRRVLGAEAPGAFGTSYIVQYTCMLKAIGPNEALLSCVHDDYLEDYVDWPVTGSSHFMLSRQEKTEKKGEPAWRVSKGQCP